MSFDATGPTDTIHPEATGRTVLWVRTEAREQKRIHENFTAEKPRFKSQFSLQGRGKALAHQAQCPQCPTGWYETMSPWDRHQGPLPHGMITLL